MTLTGWKKVDMVKQLVHAPNKIDHDSKLAKHISLDLSRELLVRGHK